MTIPRSEQIDISHTPFYHVMNRCVRHQYLCGVNKLTQTDYTHRKAWIVNRLKFLVEIFAINVCAYAVMNNHYHVVLHVDESAAQSWSTDEVIKRWGRLFPKNAKTYMHLNHKIALWRERLTSISWFMSVLNERIARAANDEEKVTGRFWEGRFKSQALLDEGALLSAMAYVDLNPIRAGLADKPETSDFTSIQERIQFATNQLRAKKVNSNQQKKREVHNIINKLAQPDKLMPFATSGCNSSLAIDFLLSEYLELVDCTGRIIREDKKASAIPSHLAPILDRLSLCKEGWLLMVRNITSHFAHAIGNEIILVNFSKKRGRRMPRNIGFVKQAFQSNR